MDKKPFRVTNEQAKAVIACSDGGMECPSTCPNYGIDDCPIGNVADYMLAADILEARELIDKQEELIREMREGIQDLKRFHVNTLENGRDRIVSLGGLCDSVEDMERGDRLVRNANAILDKTKDYA